MGWCLWNLPRLGNPSPSNTLHIQNGRRSKNGESAILKQILIRYAGRMYQDGDCTVCSQECWSSIKIPARLNSAYNFNDRMRTEISKAISITFEQSQIISVGFFFSFLFFPFSGGMEKRGAGEEIHCRLYRDGRQSD